MTDKVPFFLFRDSDFSSKTVCNNDNILTFPKEHRFFTENLLFRCMLLDFKNLAYQRSISHLITLHLLHYWLMIRELLGLKFFLNICQLT